tara:strand:- start:2335 stop:3303 length:969 start_codon:yes stop_codon:yes gene_type:complete
MRVVPTDLNIKLRQPGISGFMRLKDEELYLDAAIASHIEFLDELILVYNNCTDSTPEICRKWEALYPDKVTVYEYTPYVYPVGTVESRTLPVDDEGTLANFYNYSLSKTTREIAIKIDGDHIAVPDVFLRAAEQARELKDNEWLSLRGANLFECEGQLYMSNGYGNQLTAGSHRRGGTPPITGGDHAFFVVAEDTWHEMDPVEGYEILKLHKIKDTVVSYKPVAFLHLKGVKHDKGMKNWELDRYQDSSRQPWAQAVLSAGPSELLTLGEAEILYPNYYREYPYRLLEKYNINLPYAAPSYAKRITARWHKCLHNEESKLTH